MSARMGRIEFLGQINFHSLIRGSQVTENIGYLVGRAGFEPATNWLKASASNSL